jgi:hypothetical protein
MYKGKEDTDEMDHPEDVRLEHDVHLLLVPDFRPTTLSDIVAVCCPVSPRRKVQEVDDKGEESETQHRCRTAGTEDESKQVCKIGSPERKHSHFPDLVTPVDEPGVVYEDVDLLEILREEVEELCFLGPFCFEGLGWEIPEGLVRLVGRVSRRFVWMWFQGERMLSRSEGRGRDPFPDQLVPTRKTRRGKKRLTIDPPPILDILHPLEDLPTLARTSFFVSLLSGLTHLGELFRSTGGDDDVGAGFGEEDRWRVQDRLWWYR